MHTKIAEWRKIKNANIKTKIKSFQYKKMKITKSRKNKNNQYKKSSKIKENPAK